MQSILGDPQWRPSEPERAIARALLSIVATGLTSPDQGMPPASPLTFRMARFYQTYQGMWGARKLLREKRRWFKPAVTLPDLLEPFIETHRGVAAIYHVNQDEGLGEDQLLARWPDLPSMLAAAEASIAQLSTILRAGLQAN